MKMQKLFKASVPDLEKFKGRKVRIPTFIKDEKGQNVLLCEETIEIKHICGNRFKHNYYEINGNFLISMLRFHAQMERAKDITEEQFQAFEAMEVYSRKSDEKDSHQDGSKESSS